MPVNGPLTLSRERDRPHLLSRFENGAGPAHRPIRSKMCWMKNSAILELGLFHIPRALFLLVLGATLVACPSIEEQIEESRRAVTEALQRGDRGAAREAVAALGATIPEDPATLLELVEVLFQAGEAPRALWLLESGAEKFPERADVQVALALVALRLSNPALTRYVAARVPEDAPEHAKAIVLRATGRARAQLSPHAGPDSAGAEGARVPGQPGITWRGNMSGLLNHLALIGHNFRH